MAVVVTQAHLHARLPERRAPLLDLETVWSAPEAHAVSPHGTAAQSAYMIYTSGSTARPKGVRTRTRLWSMYWWRLAPGAHSRLPTACWP